MTILYSSTKSVKSTRPFGAGIATAPRDRRTGFTTADQTWAAQNLNAAAVDYAVVEPAADSPEWDRMAAEAAWQAGYEAGCLPM